MRVLKRKMTDEYKAKVEEVLQNLEPGDIIIYHGTALPSWAIRTFTGDEKTHTSLYLGNGKFGEAIYYHLLPLSKWGAILENNADYSFSHCKKIEIYRPETTKENKQKAIDFAKKHVGNFNRYDSLNTVKYIANGLFSLKLKQTERKKKFYCSNLAIESYGRTSDFDILENVELDNKRLVLPSDIIKSEKLVKMGEFSFN